MVRKLSDEDKKERCHSALCDELRITNMVSGRSLLSTSRLEY